MARKTFAVKKKDKQQEQVADDVAQMKLIWVLINFFVSNLFQKEMEFTLRKQIGGFVLQKDLMLLRQLIQKDVVVKMADILVLM